MSGSISYTGSFNASTLQTPGLYLNVKTAGTGAIFPALFGAVALIGVASWGPLNQATLYGSTSNMALFGPTANRTADLVAHASAILQLQQSANNGTLQLCRVSDGTDAAATCIVGLSAVSAVIGVGGSGYAVGDTITTTGGAVFRVATLSSTAVATVTLVSGGNFQTAPTGAQAQVSTSGTGTGCTLTITMASGNGLTLTSLYTGVFGNQPQAVTIATGSNSTTSAPTWKVVLQMPGLASETYDNIGGTGNAVWVAIAAAINNGQSTVRARSALMTASAGTSTGAPSPGTIGMTGGLDGGLPTSAKFIGQDTGTRTGIYAFRSSGVSHLVIADFSDTTQSGNLVLFGQSEGILCHISGPLGEASVAVASADKITQGQDNVWFKRYMGDWIYWNDNVLGIQRLMAPATFNAGNLSTLQVQQSGLNKAVPNIAATQRSKSGNAYGPDELALLTSSSIEVLCKPIPRGQVFGARIGRVGSSNAAINTDNYPVLTSFLARSITGPGSTVGSLIGEEITDDFFTDGYALFDSYLASLVASGTIQSYDVVFDNSPGGLNPPTQTALGEVIAQLDIRYLGIATIFLVNMTAGETVVTTSAIAA